MSIETNMYASRANIQMGKLSGQLTILFDFLFPDERNSLLNACRQLFLCLLQSRPVKNQNATILTYILSS